MSTQNKPAETPPRLHIGDVLRNGPNSGWVYCETPEKEPFLVAPKDSGIMSWYDAQRHAHDMKASLPDSRKLLTIYNSHKTGALNGTFNMTGLYGGGWYWSCVTDGDGAYAWLLNFGSCNRDIDLKSAKSSVRLIRSYTPA